jgi:hypothetical protein
MGPGLKYLVVELVAGFPVVLLGSRVSTWREPRKAFRAATTLLYFAWLLNFPMWGLMWTG